MIEYEDRLYFTSVRISTGFRSLTGETYTALKLRCLPLADEYFSNVATKLGGRIVGASLLRGAGGMAGRDKDHPCGPRKAYVNFTAVLHLPQLADEQEARKAAGLTGNA